MAQEELKSPLQVFFGSLDDSSTLGAGKARVRKAGRGLTVEEQVTHPKHGNSLIKMGHTPKDGSAALSAQGFRNSVAPQ
jgi:hypothetical protein